MLFSSKLPSNNCLLPGLGSPSEFPSNYFWCCIDTAFLKHKAHYVTTTPHSVKAFYCSYDRFLNQNPKPGQFARLCVLFVCSAPGLPPQLYGAPFPLGFCFLVTSVLYIWPSFLFFFFLPPPMACGILVPRPGIEPTPASIGSAESSPLDHQGSPRNITFKGEGINPLVTWTGDF